MSRRTRYEPLQTEDADGDMPVTPTPDPPAYPATQDPQQDLTVAQMAVDTDKQDATSVAMPPSYDVATKLPTYEEAEILKIEQEQLQQIIWPPGSTKFCYLARTLKEVARAWSKQQVEPENFTYMGMKLGTDGIFLCTFIISFLFNWMGLLATLCLSETVAGRLGAIAGFGLSIIKWAAILKHNALGHGMAQQDSWIWWLLIILGFMIFIRGCLHYIGLKYQWYQMKEGGRQRAYLIF